MRRLRSSVVLAILGSILASGTVNAGDTAPRLRADLEGRPINAIDAGDYYCHDFDYPRIRCFTTAEGLEAAIANGADAEAQAVFGPDDYVTIYSEPSYAGSYMHVSQNYDTLFWIGWNDRISSFKARNSQSGSFWADWYATGRRTPFCCNQTVPWLISEVDNTFTSVYRE